MCVCNEIFLIYIYIYIYTHTHTHRAWDLNVSKQHEARLNPHDPILASKSAVNIFVSALLPISAYSRACLHMHLNRHTFNAFCRSGSNDISSSC
jgi:hypothetical protein